MRDLLRSQLAMTRSQRSRCRACEMPITDPVRVEATFPWNDSEATRFFHVECFVKSEPELGRQAFRLASSEIRDLARRLVPLMDEPHQAPLAPRAKRPEVFDLEVLDDVMHELLTQLEKDPTDRKLLEVLSDALSMQGAPRGELISLSLSKRDPEIDLRIAELQSPLTPRDPRVRSFRWGVGFLSFVELTPKGRPTSSVDELLAHPRFRLLAELQLTGWPSMPLQQLPPTVRMLTLARCAAHSTNGVADFEHLTHLRISNPVASAERIQPLRSLALRALEIHGDLTLLERKREIPHLTSLVVDGAPLEEDLIPTLRKGGWLANLEELRLQNLSFEDSSVRELIDEFRGSRLKKLVIHAVNVTSDTHKRLNEVAEHLTLNFANVEPRAVETYSHNSHPEWGIGRVVERKGDKISLQFEGAGLKIFKVNSPFLKQA